MTNKESLRRLLQPKTVAVFGGKMAAEVVRQCDLIGYEGKIWPVNPKRSEMGGRPCFASVDELPGVPDAAFIGVPRGATIEIVQQLAKLGAGGAVCYASGFAEMGDEEGEQHQRMLQDALGEMAIVGPNCYGVLNYLEGVTLWPDEQGGKRTDKGVAIIAQSGNISISISMQQRSVPLAYLISTGNQAGCTVPDYIDSLLDDDRVTAIGLHLEGLDDLAAFSRAAVKALRKKVPIVIMKAGASELGSQIAVSHTSSLAGSDDLYNTLFERVGIMRVHSIPEFLEALKFLSVVGPLPSNKIASISCSGGEAGIMADRGSAHTLAFPPLIPHQEAQLNAVLGERVLLGNPLDYHTYIWFDEAAKYRCFSAMMLGEQDLTIKVLDYPRPDICDLTVWKETGETFSRAVQDGGHRGVVVATMHENMPEDIREGVLAYGVAPMLGIEECLVAVRGAVQIYQRQQMAETVQALASVVEADGEIVTLDEAQSKAILGQYGVRTPVSAETTTQTAAQTATEIGFPVVVKLLSDEIVHKSDVGGVHLNLKSEAEVNAAVASMAHLGDQFLVETMAAKPITELILGLTRDPQFGLALVIGAGGILVELFKDSQTLLFPVSRAEVESALDKLKIAPLLNGYRGQAAADKTAIVDAVMGLAQFGADNSAELQEVDINPLFVYADGVLAVDAVIRTKRTY
ncbi:MAG: acetate--CoA ligase family protein [Candidatus Promineifilaceae bacterium]